MFWLRAYGNDDTKEALSPEQREAERDGQLRSFANVLELETAGLGTEEVRATLAGRIAARGERCLWVVDDLPSGLSRDALGLWLAPHPLARTLLTMRNREHDALGTTIEVGVLKEEEAYQLLCDHRRPDGEAEVAAARGILVDVGFHSLAVDVLGALLGSAASPWDFVTFRKRLGSTSRDALKLAERLRESLPNRTEKYVATVLQHSIEQLSEEGKDVLRLASVLATAPIPSTLLTAVFQRVEQLEEEDAEEVVFAAVEEVLNLSLAEGAGGGGVEVHTLVSRAIRFTDTETDRAMGLKHAALAAVISTFEQAADPRMWPVLEQLVAHGRELVGGADSLPELALLGGVAAFENARGSYRLAAADHRREVIARERLLGEEHPDTLSSKANLAKALYGLGDLEAARALNEQTLDTQRRVLGDEHPETLSSMSNLALTFRALGDLAGSRALNQQALDIRRRVFGEEHPDTLLSMNNLAVTLHALGDLAGARDLNQRTLDAQRTARGEEHPYTLGSMHNLAYILYASGDLAGARDLNQRTLDARLRVLGADHPETLSSVNNLAATLHALGDLAGARDLTQRALDAKRRVLGEEHADTLISINNLASILYALGDLAGSRALNQQALDTQRRVVGKEHPETTTSAWNLYRTLSRLGDQAEATALFERDLAWLLDRDPDSLGESQRSIRKGLVERMRDGEDTP